MSVGSSLLRAMTRHSAMPVSDENDMSLPLAEILNYRQVRVFCFQHLPETLQVSSETPSPTPNPRKWTSHLPAHAAHAALPGRVGEGDHPGPDQGRRGPRRGGRPDRGQAPALDSEKVQAVRDFLAYGGSVSVAARNFGVSRPTVRAVEDGTYLGQHDST